MKSIYSNSIWVKIRRRIRRFIQQKLGVDLVRYKSARTFRRDRIWYQEQEFDFHIQRGDRVLDIGSGPTPFPYATILCERYLTETVHRAGDIQTYGIPLVQADIYALPFKNKSFDFVYCAHVLEHLSDPMAACNEIMRVGKRGYIETPNFMKDCLFGWAKTMNHLWHTIAIGNTLCFFEYTDRQASGIETATWSDIIFGNSYHPLQDAFIDHQDLFHTMFYWQEQFDVHVYRQPLH